MDTAHPQKFPVTLDRNLAMVNCTENQVCTSCDTVVLVICSSHKEDNNCVSVANNQIVC